MANQPQGHAGAQQEAGTAPEAIWFTHIQEWYPDLLGSTYFLPPLHFNRTPQRVETIADQAVIVRDNPPPSPRRRPRRPPPPPPPSAATWTAGTVFVENDPGIQVVRIQDSDLQDDIAQERCLRALSNLPHQGMMVLSNLEFQKYLNNHTNPLHAAGIARLPTIQHPSIPQKIKDGRCDLIVLHRTYGLLIGEIKPVGGDDYFRQQSPSQQSQILISQLERAIDQLQNQNTGLRHLMSDLPPVRVTLILMLTNITAHQLEEALGSSPLLLQTLCRSLAITTGVGGAVRQCLCEEDIEQPSAWWNGLHRAGPDPTMTDCLYQRLVARLVEAQLRSMEPAAAAYSQRLCYDFTDGGFSAGAAVARLQQHIRPGPVLVIFDEADCSGYSDRYVAFLTEVHDQLPAVSVWGADVWTLEKRLSGPVPCWLEVRSLHEALRCPPSVTALLGQARAIQLNDVLPYSAPRHPVATHGPPVHRRRHNGQPCHSGGDRPEECDVCTDDVMQFLMMELRVGQPGQALQYRDVIILCPGEPRADSVTVRRLRQGGVPVRVTSSPPSPADEEELALAVTDIVMVTDWKNVTGLERRVVVVLGSRRLSGWNLEALSWCSGCLFAIDCVDDDDGDHDDSDHDDSVQ
ncbi:hypothetical protein ACOMHN_037711 [Nucella lapillus]